MKKVLLFLLGFIVLVIVALAAIPYFFKDDIKQTIDQQMAESLNADVYFDADKFSLSLFSSFPDLTVSLADFGVANQAPFAGDTLVQVEQFELTIDLSSINFGSNIMIE